MEKEKEDGLSIKVIRLGTPEVKVVDLKAGEIIEDTEGIYLDYPIKSDEGHYLFKTRISVQIVRNNKVLRFDYNGWYQVSPRAFPPNAKVTLSDKATSAQVTHFVKSTIDSVRGFLQNLALQPEFSFMKGFIYPYQHHSTLLKKVEIATITGIN